MTIIALLFAGALLCNSIPHITAGLQGLPFYTPFAKPRGVGKSSPLKNLIWGASNLFTSLTILARHHVQFGTNVECAAVGIGAAVFGIYLASHFGKLNSEDRSV